MPTDSVNIYLTMTDKASPVLVSVGDKTKLLEKETAKLTQGYNALQKANAPLLEQQKKLKTALEQQKKAVAQASSTYREYGDELSRNACESAIAEQERLRTELKNTEQAIKSNQKTYRDYQETIRKGAAGSGAGTTSDTLGSGLFFGQLGQMFGASLGVLSDSLLNSAIGTPTASLASNILSGVVSGAAIGKIVPGFGTAFGAVAGGISGLMSGGAEIFEAKDDAFNDYYKDYDGYSLLRLDDSDKEEEDVALQARVSRANAWEADLYLSIHHNAGVNGGAGGGIVAITHPRSSAESVQWRDALYTSLISHTGLSGNRATPETTADLFVLRKTNMPAVLLELGFMDSSTDVPIILTDEYARSCPHAIVEVLAEKGGLAQKPRIDPPPLGPPMGGKEHTPPEPSTAPAPPIPSPGRNWPSYWLSYT